MNIALEQTEEYVGGQLKNKCGDAFIRGNNGETSCEKTFHIIFANALIFNSSSLHQHSKKKNMSLLGAMDN